jgi:hypothetical protein
MMASLPAMAGRAMGYRKSLLLGPLRRETTLSPFRRIGVCDSRHSDAARASSRPPVLGVGQAGNTSESQTEPQNVEYCVFSPLRRGQDMQGARFHPCLIPSIKWVDGSGAFFYDGVLG